MDSHSQHELLRSYLSIDIENDSPEIVSSTDGRAIQLTESTRWGSDACAICRLNFRVKSYLKCGHAFCFQCLLELCNKPKLLACPTCLKVFTSFNLTSTSDQIIPADLITTIHGVVLGMPTNSVPPFHIEVTFKHQNDLPSGNVHQLTVTPDIYPQSQTETKYKQSNGELAKQCLKRVHICVSIVLCVGLVVGLSTWLMIIPTIKKITKMV